MVKPELFKEKYAGERPSVFRQGKREIHICIQTILFDFGKRNPKVGVVSVIAQSVFDLGIKVIECGSEYHCELVYPNIEEHSKTPTANSNYILYALSRLVNDNPSENIHVLYGKKISKSTSPPHLHHQPTPLKK